MTESTNESDDSRKLNDSEQSTDSVNNHNDQETDAENEQAVPTYKRHAEKADESAMIKKALLALLVLIVLGVIAYGLYKSNQHSEPEVVTLQGQMQMQQTSIAAKVPGRIAKILVTEGDAVTVGQQLIEMDSPEINAKINQALAGKQMAQSQLDKAENGARPQEIAQAKAAWQANKAASDLAENTYQRVNRLYEEALWHGKNAMRHMRNI
ncbi:predicted membrane fusion protein (MFP) component of efflux pump, membrane anchor protein YbhG [Psychrobacter sp. JCM 18902]|nr:predicted membrane fusion protein (MFP) component of efflux pump, membrane anchor protein YbhG [Psychrobacter sp. JCM 18902]